MIDGGSTDDSVEIIQRYAPWLAYWISEPDHGQSNAINKGWARATGDMVAYLNSDDFYLPRAFQRAVEVLQTEPNCSLVYSDGYWVDENSHPFKIQHSGDFNATQMLSGQTPYGIPQPTAFMRRDAVLSVGGLDETLHMAMDFDLWAKLLLRYRSRYVPGKPLAALRFHGTMKTQTRVLEDRLSTLHALNRALNDPMCPPGVTRKHNPLYQRLYLDLAEASWHESRDMGQALRYVRLALQDWPINTIVQASQRLAVRAYRAYIPRRAQTWFRRIRGTELPEVADVWN